MENLPRDPIASGFDKKAEAHFLSDEFGTSAIKAAALVADTDAEAETLAAELLKEQQADDPLADAPVPDPQKDPQHVEPRIGDLEKPVQHRPSAAS
ncbi:MAG: hypothetical protein IR164_03250 [Devosia sp.]|jgi:hypothetical protein|uniref:hypothetical protein n=1 Tax=Devosia sp. TaxID=1871048 RepID=UPI0019FD9E4D|nr:hypothetical protein [Devosia sp.]MBF0677942.1 hypothetical protein [Devosia sp.]